MNRSISKICNKKLLYKPLQAFILGLCIATGTSVMAQLLPVKGNLINLNSREGEQLLLESKARTDYLPLSLQFVTQDNLAYCGVASIVMVLNALEIPAPESPEYGKFRLFTQENFFNNEKTRQVVEPQVVARKGMTLDQLSQLIETYAVKVQVYHAGNSSLEEFRKLAVQNLEQPGNFILVNYLRSSLGQETGGHISPIGAYNEKTDRFLIFDVSRYKYPPIWVSTSDLWQSMNTLDSDSGKTRGFVLINPQ
ncbi:phytochelatin synthase family protein [Ancylothrix sp. C2]|uniref:phytochelatin synthase family protein n=1 Tax=Ancylothrix sp. D3o TaxID=2953691 RepID=UPI0021BB545C|nr:phytochelatin synthase family protein [Ancylothrix sp. D3o]MCT7952538.1 phytochelatin synthase family protein [Ancylothrix sp. D3o]